METIVLYPTGLRIIVEIILQRTIEGRKEGRKEGHLIREYIPMRNI
jgi:hypothetical protein